MFTPTSLYTLLTQAMTDGGATALASVEKVAREADGLEITFPAYASLCSWGKPGFDSIVKVAVEGQSVRSKSAALTLLTALSASGRVPSIGMIMVVAGFVQEVNGRLDPIVVRSLAGHALREILMSVEVDELLIPVSQSVMHLSMEAPHLAEELVAALSTRWFRFGPSALAEYEELLSAKADDEPSFQEFFCRYPQFLDPMAVKVWSQPDFHGALEPDFVVRRVDDSYLVVEIEIPGKQLMTLAGQLSAGATHAEQQAVEYELFLSERVMEARNHFPGFSRAECLVVIGSQAHLTEVQRRNLRMANGRRQDVRIVGFDWLLERARTVVGNVGEGRIEVVRRHRIV